MFRVMYEWIGAMWTLDKKHKHFMHTTPGRTRVALESLFA